MSEKFTKGPWEIEHVFLFDTEPVFDVGPAGALDDYRICRVYNEAGEDSSMEANAHLIAASPLMFEALEEARSQIIEVCQSTGTPLPEASIERYDTALQQARGES